MGVRSKDGSDGSEGSEGKEGGDRNAIPEVAYPRVIENPSLEGVLVQVGGARCVMPLRVFDI